MGKIRRGFQFNLHGLAVLTKDDGETVVVRIEGRDEHINLDEPMYHVRECVSRIGYLATECTLKPYVNSLHEPLLRQPASA